jgi:hypothetical protein
MRDTAGDVSRHFYINGGNMPGAAVRLRIFPTSFLAMLGLLASASPGQGQCDPDGEVRFVCGPVSPEDLVRVPDSPWVLVSGMEDDGYLYATDVRNLTSQVLFPTQTGQARHDRETYGSCPGPVTGMFRPHGLSLQPGDGTTHTLYVVRHGEREAIEVYEVDVGAASPTLVWIGCVVAPEGVSMNSVAALPGSGFVVTHFRIPFGEVLEWQSGAGWAQVPGSETAGPNGIVASADGRWLYIGGWGTRSLIRLSRGRTPVQIDAVEVAHHIDNVRWAPDGSLLAAGHVGPTQASITLCMGQGQCDGVTSRVTRVDPERLTAQEIVRYPSNDLLILGTVAIEVGNEIWVGGIAGGDRIARFAVR